MVGHVVWSPPPTDRRQYLECVDVLSFGDLLRFCLAGILSGAINVFPLADFCVRVSDTNLSESFFFDCRSVDSVGVEFGGINDRAAAWYVETRLFEFWRRGL